MATRSPITGASPTDNFNRSTGALGANWSNRNNAAAGDVTITANAHIEGGSFGNGAVAVWVGSGTFTADQYSSIVVNTGDTGTINYGTGVVCRQTGSDATHSCYFVRISNTCEFGKITNGTTTQFPGFPQALSLTGGDRLELECEGTTIRVLKNGTAVGGQFTVTDSTQSSGVAGVMMVGDVSAIAIGDDWEGGNLSTVTKEQTHYRWRNDDGSETTATWAAAEDSALTATRSVNKRLRALIDTTGDLASTQFQLEYKLSTDSVYDVVEPVGGGSAAYGAIGTATTTGTTAPTVAYPSGITRGQQLVMFVVNRPNASTVSTPSGWVAPSGNTVTGGAGSEGAGTGVIRLTVFTRIADGTETGSVTLAISGGTSVCAAIVRVTRTTGKTWAVALASGSDSSAGTSVSITFGSDPGVTAGDVVLVGYGNSEDTATFASQSLSQTGMTYGTMTERLDQAVTTGNDCKLVITTHDVTSGTSSAAAVYTATASGTNAANSAGPAIMVRLRQIDQPIQLALSANVTASGEATTGQLTPPAGKTAVSDFVAGRMQDDENPADAVDITTDDYTELEWCLAASSQATDANVYQFRVTAAGTALSTYTVTPSWTIGGGGGIKRLASAMSGGMRELTGGM